MSPQPQRATDRTKLLKELTSQEGGPGFIRSSGYFVYTALALGVASGALACP